MSEYERSVCGRLVSWVDVLDEHKFVYNFRRPRQTLTAKLFALRIVDQSDQCRMLVTNSRPAVLIVAVLQMLRRMMIQMIAVLR